MGSCEDSGVIEEPVSSDVVLSEEGSHEQLMCSIAVREVNTEPADGQGCMKRIQLIKENGGEGDSDVDDFLVEKIVEIKDGKIEAVFMGTEETHAEQFESQDGEVKVSGVDALCGVSVRLIERENQNTVNEGSEEGVEVGRCRLKGVDWKDAETVKENADDTGGLEICLAGVDVDSFDHLIDAVKGSSEVADEQKNQMYTFESAESTRTFHQAATICTIPAPWTNQTDHNTDICSVGGVLIGQEGSSNDRETPLTECAISREVTMDEDFFGDMNEDCAPWPWWKNSTGTFCGNVSLASVEENTSNEISFTRIGKASCDPHNVPMNSGIVYDAPFEEISEYHEHSRFGCHDHLSLYDSDKLLEGKPEDDCMVSERRRVEETEVTEKPEGASPCRLYPADVNSSCVILNGLLKTSHIYRSGRKTQAKRAARNSLNANKELYSLAALAFDDKTVKKKRTYTSKTARASVWGALNNISQLFAQKKGPEFIPVKSRKSKKSGVEKANEKTQKNTKRNVDFSEKKSTSSVNRIRLKVKLGKEIIGSGLNKEMVESDLPTSFAMTVREGGSTVMKELCPPENKTGKQHECFDHEGYKVKISDGPYQASRQSAESLKTNLYFDKTGGNVESKYTEISNYAKDEAVSDRYLDPETSPDSEVINIVPEVQGVERSRECVSVSDLSHAQNITVHEDAIIVNGKNDNAPPQSLHPQQCGALIIQKANDNITGLESGLGSSSLENPDYSLYKRQICKANSRPSKSAKTRQRNGCSKRGDQSRIKGKDKGVKLIEFKRDSPMKGGSVDGDGEECTDGANSGAEYAAVISLETTNNMLSSLLVEQQFPRNAWVRCDDCLKWRRISVALADSIEDTNSRWTCKENLDKNFADCSVPQEKSNVEINAELEISDASGEEDENDARRNYKQLEFSRPTVLQQSSFVHIGSNKFTHRSRRTQSIDEVMVCHCKPSLDRRLGCGDECLNRMLNIECVQGTCPCGDPCSNQQFQQRKYAHMQWFRCGQKGFGLQLLEDVRKETFIIEYVGEVLDMPTYEARQRDYAAKGHRHFYFMTLNGSEVIDASAKGNLGRFINHSCDPNCRTEKEMQSLLKEMDSGSGVTLPCHTFCIPDHSTYDVGKWMVNGEICIGLFAIRDIKKGEELTFDYNYVRVFGAAVKKCVCGSRHCRGYIGGDPLNSEVIVQGDSDDEFPEPVMLTDGDTLDHLDNATRPCSLDLASGLKGTKGRHEVKGTQSGPGFVESVHQFSLHQPERSVDVAETERVESSSLPSGIALDLEFTAGSFISDTQKPIPLDTDVSQTTENTDLSSPRTSKGKFSDDTSKGLKSDKSDERRNSVKLNTLVKMSKFAKATNKGKENNVSPISNKVQGVGGKSLMMYTKSRRIVEASSCGHFEAVEEKLNELLDADGGISKRKDAAKGYLKLLFLTAASGDCANGGAIQSNRDLSMILDAVLKTKSRVVLIDILSKNGLQMLHNTLKQYRRDFKKIPILRKLLKVLEYLASREILTLEHISGGSPYPGMESFRESILSLTEHDDKQVHQIARNFRDKYIPKSIRKTCHPDRAPALLNNRRDPPNITPTEAADCLSQSISASVTTPNGSLLQDGAASSIDSSSISGRSVGKRKSRWDQPGDPVPDPVNSVDTKENCSEDIPPGFSPCVDISRVLLNTSSTVAEVSQRTVQTWQRFFHQAVGQLQERFNARLPVSYGIPFYILQNLGKPQAEAEGWVIAPGLPFHPFPPLPQYPQDKKRRSLSPGDVSLTKDISAERKLLDECCTASVIDQSSPGISAANASNENTCSDNQPLLKRLRASPQYLSRNYFKQQKLNTTKVGPPWLWRRKCWGFSVRGGSGSSSIGNVVNGNKSSSFTEN